MRSNRRGCERFLEACFGEGDESCVEQGFDGAEGFQDLLVYGGVYLDY